MRTRTAVAIVALVLAVVLGAGAAALTAERHPEIRAAMKALQNAERDLSRAAHDYGGHRVKAMELIRAAQNELREGLAYDEAHERR